MSRSNNKMPNLCTHEHKNKHNRSTDNKSTDIYLILIISEYPIKMFLGTFIIKCFFYPYTLTN